jgi:hypothetical protein
MKAEISFDLVMEDVMSFVEGTYRLPGGDWRVFIFGPDSSVTSPEAKAGKYANGVAGVFVGWPESLTLNKVAVLRTLSELLDVTEWTEVRGPDSMDLR